LTAVQSPGARAASFVRQHQVLAYFLLTFAISWGGILAIVLVAGLPGTTAALNALFLPVFVAMALGPSLAGLTLTFAFEGRAGLLHLARSLTRWRIAAPCYVLALATPVVALVVLGIFSAFSPAYTPTVFGSSGGVPLLVTGIVIGVAAGFLEELGWTGFAARRLLSTRSVVATAVLIGVPHGLWHFLVAYFWGDGASYGLLFIPYFVVAWVVTLTALRLLIVWLYQRTQSGLIATLTHAGYTASLTALWPAGLTPMETIAWTSAFALTLGALALALTIFFPTKR
jgi:membrane protease YdiL (CAAX protease family)